MSDQSQGPRLETLQELARYWATDYDWRKIESKLNSFPQFTTKIDGLDFHFIHVRSNVEHAMPMLVAHGWPGSIVEQIKLIGPLTDPAAHGSVAIAHKMIRLIYLLLTRNVPYRDPNIDYDAMSARKNAPRWIKQLKVIGAWPDSKVAHTTQ